MIPMPEDWFPSWENGSFISLGRTECTEKNRCYEVLEHTPDGLWVRPIGSQERMFLGSADLKYQDEGGYRIDPLEDWVNLQREK